MISIEKSTMGSCEETTDFCKKRKQEILRYTPLEVCTKFMSKMYKRLLVSNPWIVDKMKE